MDIKFAAKHDDRAGADDHCGGRVALPVSSPMEAQLQAIKVIKAAAHNVSCETLNSPSDTTHGG